MKLHATVTRWLCAQIQARFLNTNIHFCSTYRCEGWSKPRLASQSSAEQRTGNALTNCWLFINASLPNVFTPSQQRLMSCRKALLYFIHTQDTSPSTSWYVHFSFWLQMWCTGDTKCYFCFQPHTHTRPCGWQHTCAYAFEKIHANCCIFKTHFCTTEL